MKGKSDSPIPSVSKPKKKRSGLVPLVLLLTGLGLSYMLYQHYTLYHTLKKSGESIDAEVTEVIPASGYFKGYDVSIEYQVAEEFFYLSQNMNSGPKVGSKMTVLYLEDNPQQSMLKESVLFGRKEILIGVAGIFLILIGLFLLIFRS